MTPFVLLIAVMRFENVVAKQAFIGGATGTAFGTFGSAFDVRPH